MPDVRFPRVRLCSECAGFCIPTLVMPACEFLFPFCAVLLSAYFAVVCRNFGSRLLDLAPLVAEMHLGRYQKRPLTNDLHSLFFVSSL